MLEMRSGVVELMPVLETQKSASCQIPKALGLPFQHLFYGAFGMLKCGLPQLFHVFAWYHLLQSVVFGEDCTSNGCGEEGEAPPFCQPVQRVLR